MNFIKKYDVVIAGGGVAGAAAALASARRGAQTALIEKTVLVGGLATSGLINGYLPLCDGNGTQVSFGIAEEFFKASIKYGVGDVPDKWKDSSGNISKSGSRYQAVFSPASFALALDELLIDANVDLWLDTVVCKTVTQEQRITAVEVSNKSGYGQIHAKCFIDATGDADLAFLAGVNCPQEDNAIAYWAIEANEKKTEENLSMFKYGCSCDQTMGQPQINGKVVSDFVLAGRNIYRKHLAEQYQNNKSNRTTRFPLALPTMAQLRMTRRIDGLFTLEDGMEWNSFHDSIGLVADWRKSGYVWEVPYRSLLPSELKGLLAAGRCISSAGDAWDVMRVIPAAAVTGEAAGVAAALAAQKGICPDELDINAVQNELRYGSGLPLHFADIGLDNKKNEMVEAPELVAEV